MEARKEEWSLMVEIWTKSRERTQIRFCSEQTLYYSRQISNYLFSVIMQVLFPRRSILLNRLSPTTAVTALLWDRDRPLSLANLDTRSRHFCHRLIISKILFRSYFYIFSRVLLFSFSFNVEFLEQKKKRGVFCKRRKTFNWPKT